MAPRSPRRAEQAVHERREQKLAALHDRLTAGIERLTSSDEWVSWLQVASRFHSYSFNNTLLIHAQRPDATHVAGYKVWRQLGRQVNKGEHGIQILAPVVRRRLAASEERAAASSDVSHRATARGRATEDAPDSRRVVGFRVAHVFDVSQTSGKGLPEPERPSLIAGQAPAGMWSQLAAQVESNGFALRRGPCGGERNGYTDFLDHVVVVRDDVDDAQAVKTLAHELGHVMLHAPDQLAARDTRLCRGTAEVEAESIAFLISAARGLDVSGYTFPYVARWAASVDGGDRGVADVIQRTATRVLSTAHLVLDATEPGVEHRPSTGLSDRVRERSEAGKARTAEIWEQAVTLAVDGDAQRPQVGSVGDARVVERIVAANAAAAEWWGHLLHRPEGTGPRQYLLDRGVGHVLAPDSPWYAGYAENRWTSLVDHLRTEGFSDSDLLVAGLAMTSRQGNVIDRFRDRIMLPIRRPNGGIVGFIGRAMPGDAPEVPKYLNTARTAAFVKGNVLFGLSEQRDTLTPGRTLLVEGPFDVLAIAGVRPDTAAVAPCGTALTASQVTLLAEHTSRVAVALDPDSAGMAASLRAHDLLLREFREPEWVPLPLGADPCDLANASGDQLGVVLDLLPRPLADAVVDQAISAHDLSELQQLVVANRHAAHVIARLPEHQVARQMVRVAEQLDLELAAVHDAVTAAFERGVAPGRDRRRVAPLCPTGAGICAASRLPPAKTGATSAPTWSCGQRRSRAASYAGEGAQASQRTGAANARTP